MRYRRFRRCGAALLCLAAAHGISARAVAQDRGSVELVDPKVFRVCADPRSLPYSDQEGQGFEDKIAALFAAKLDKTVAYTYFPRAVGFVRATLNALRCDVIMSDAVGDDMVQTTTPYYRAFYALVARAGSPLDGVVSLSDPRLKGKHLGVIAGTPPATILAEDGLIGDAKPFPLMVDTRYDAPSKAMIDEIAAGSLDGGILWGPIAGYYAKLSGTKLVVVPLLKEHGVPMDFRIAMGVRRSDKEWRRTLDRLIAQNQDAINRILVDYGVPIVDEQGRPIAP